VTLAERALIRCVVWATTGAAAALPLLVVPEPGDPTTTLMIHLAALSGFGVALAFHLAPLADGEWFVGTGSGPIVRRGAAAGLLVAAAVVSTGVVAVATAAALRFDASVQFLQMLAAVGITAVAGSAGLGVRRLAGRGAAATVAMGTAALCIWSLWRYLDLVGFGADGGWVVDGAQIRRTMLPVFLGSGFGALVVFVVAVGRTRRR
jgi:hypothetical protein